MEIYNPEDHSKSLKSILNGFYYDREEKNFDDEISYGKYGYLMKNYIKNYFDKSIYILDALNNVIEVKPETNKGNYRNKIIIRSSSAASEFNKHSSTYTLTKKKGSEIVITNEHFDEDDLVFILELSLFIGKDEHYIRWRKKNNPQIASLEEKKEILHNLYMNSFNVANNFFEIMISDPGNELEDFVYTIINGEIVTINVSKDTYLEREIIISYRKDREIIEYKFSLDDLLNPIPEFKLSEGRIFMSTSITKIEEILREKYSDLNLGMKMKYQNEIDELKNKYELEKNELKEDIENKNDQITKLEKEIKKEKAITDNLYFKLNVHQEIDKNIMTDKEMAFKLGMMDKKMKREKNKAEYEKEKHEQDMEYKREKHSQDVEIGNIIKDKEKIKASTVSMDFAQKMSDFLSFKL